MFYTELKADKRKNYLAFATGSGITPLISLIKTTLAVEPNSHFTLVYGNRHRPSIIFREQLEALKNRYMHRLALHHILSREQMDVALNQGRIDAAKCAEFCPRLIHLPGVDEVFLCGPQEMIFTVSEWLQQQGVEKKRIHFELFHTLDASQAGTPHTCATRAIRTDAASLKDKVSEVTVRLDGISHVFTLPFDGDSVLNAALLEGV